VSSALENAGVLTARVLSVYSLTMLKSPSPPSVTRRHGLYAELLTVRTYSMQPSYCTYCQG